MKIIIISDGPFGDRAADAIKSKFPDTKIVYIDSIDRNKMIDEYEFKPSVESELESSDLIISYVRHPDIIFEICDIGKPTIVAIFNGQGLLSQIKEYNENVIMPASMCSVEPNTGIPVIDEFIEIFGRPAYKIKLSDDKKSIEEITLIRQSPCGATIRNVKFLEGLEINPENFSKFALNVLHDCRESVAYRMANVEMNESATANHLLPLIDALKKEDAAIFEREDMKKYLNNLDFENDVSIK